MNSRISAIVERCALCLRPKSSFGAYVQRPANLILPTKSVNGCLTSLRACSSKSPNLQMLSKLQKTSSPAAFQFVLSLIENENAILKQVLADTKENAAEIKENAAEIKAILDRELTDNKKNAAEIKAILDRELTDNKKHAAEIKAMQDRDLKKLQMELFALSDTFSARGLMELFEREFPVTEHQHNERKRKTKSGEMRKSDRYLSWERALENDLFASIIENHGLIAEDVPDVACDLYHRLSDGIHSHLPKMERLSSVDYLARIPYVTPNCQRLLKSVGKYENINIYLKLES